MNDTYKFYLVIQNSPELLKEYHEGMSFKVLTVFHPDLFEGIDLQYVDYYLVSEQLKGYDVIKGSK